MVKYSTFTAKIYHFLLACELCVVFKAPANVLDI